jgi:hypothetical protein
MSRDRCRDRCMSKTCMVRLHGVQEHKGRGSTQWVPHKAIRHDQASCRFVASCRFAAWLVYIINRV